MSRRGGGRRPDARRDQPSPAAYQGGGRGRGGGGGRGGRGGEDISPLGNLYILLSLYV